jgi:hypothetical protein
MASGVVGQPCLLWVRGGRKASPERGKRLKRTDASSENGARARLSSAFAAFVAAYHAASYAIDTRPHRRRLRELAQRAVGERDAAVLRLRNDLEIEKEFLLRELVARGGMDEEGARMKREIEVELMHLRHLAAVAGAALARMTAQVAPVDPVESMQVDLAEREAAEALNDEK